MEAWKEKIEWLTKCHEYRELDCIDGDPVEFEWTSRTNNTSVASRDPKDDGREHRILWTLRRTQKDSLKDIGHSSDQERTPTAQRTCGITLLRQ